MPLAFCRTEPFLLDSRSTQAANAEMAEARLGIQLDADFWPKHSMKVLSATLEW